MICLLQSQGSETCSQAAGVKNRKEVCFKSQRLPENQINSAQSQSTALFASPPPSLEQAGLQGSPGPCKDHLQGSPRRATWQNHLEGSSVKIILKGSPGSPGSCKLDHVDHPYSIIGAQLPLPPLFHHRNHSLELHALCCACLMLYMPHVVRASCCACLMLCVPQAVRAYAVRASCCSCLMLCMPPAVREPFTVARLSARHTTERTVGPIILTPRVQAMAYFVEPFEGARHWHPCAGAQAECGTSNQVLNGTNDLHTEGACNGAPSGVSGPPGTPAPSLELRLSARLPTKCPMGPMIFTQRVHAMAYLLEPQGHRAPPPHRSSGQRKSRPHLQCSCGQKSPGCNPLWHLGCLRARVRGSMQRHTHTSEGD
eukprot:1160256-Pelagomonas_calceolata.AAC.8